MLIWVYIHIGQAWKISLATVGRHFKLARCGYTLRVTSQAKCFIVDRYNWLLGKARNENDVLWTGKWYRRFWPFGKQKTNWTLTLTIQQKRLIKLTLELHGSSVHAHCTHFIIDQLIIVLLWSGCTPLPPRQSMQWTWRFVERHVIRFWPIGKQKNWTLTLTYITIFYIDLRI